MDQKLKQVNDIEIQVEIHERDLKDLRAIFKDNSQSNSRSPDRALTKQEKRDLLMRRGRILNIQEVSNNIVR